MTNYNDRVSNLKQVVPNVYRKQEELDNFASKKTSESGLEEVEAHILEAFSALMTPSLCLRASININTPRTETTQSKFCKNAQKLNDCRVSEIITFHLQLPGRNNGRNFSGIRALTVVKISHRSRY